MNTIMYNIKEKVKRNRSVSVIVAAVVTCALLISALLIFMPKGYAGTGTSMANPLEISMSNRTQDIATGKYYKIPAGTYTSGITFNIAQQTGTAGTSSDVYVILDNVNFNLSTDEPAIKFTYLSANMPAPDTEGVKVHLMLEGDSNIKSTKNGAYSPLIQIENYSYIVEKYLNLSAPPYEMGKSFYYTQKLSLSIEEADASKRNSITLITAKDSYGAAIGTGEAQQFMNSLGLETVLWGTSTSWKDMSALYSIPGYGVYMEGIFLKDSTPESDTGETPLTYGVADVTIKSGAVNILGNGYGAAIGNGGCVNDTVNVNVASDLLISLYGKTLTVNPKQTEGSVKITGGTVSVIMSQDSKGSCFMNSSFGGELAEDGKVTIDGGSVYLKRQIDYTEPTPYDYAVNSDGQVLYLYEALFQKDIDDNHGIGNYNLQNVFITEKEYTYTINKYIDINDAENSASADTVKYLETKVSLGAEYGNKTYNFNGYYHEKQYSDSTASGDKADKLYFYLPAIRLNIYDLKIEGTEGGLQYGTSMKDSLGNIANDKTILEGYSYSLYPGGSGIAVKQNKYVCIKVTDVPSYCTDLRVTYTESNDSGTASKIAQVYDAGNGTYYAYTDMINGNVVVKFEYIMGKYSINYNYGLLPEDFGASITNQNPATGTCGKTVILEDAEWQNHKFEGWYYDAAFTRPVTSLTSVTLDDSITVYAKWTCKVSYVSTEGQLVGIREYTVPYGSTFDILDEVYVPDINLGAQAGMIELTGWKCDGSIYSENGTLSSIVTVRKDLVVEAQFARSGYYVYITATYKIDPRNKDIKDFAKSFKMIYANNTAQEFNPIDTNNYYRTIGFVDDTQPATVSIVPIDGYKIKATSVKNKQGNDISLIAGASGVDQFSFQMPEEDVYISVVFEEWEYTITYYDEIDGSLVEIDGTPNPSKYTVSTPDFVFTEPANGRGLYYRFLGFKELGKTEYITGVSKGSSGNLVLVAQWEPMGAFDIVVEGNGMGTIKTYVGGVETNEAMPGDEVTIVATVGPGVRLNSILYKWTNPIGSITTTTKEYDVTQKSEELKFTMPEADVYVTAEFEAIQYIITYLNLHNATNTNPTTYTIFDVIDLERPEKEGWKFKNWQLITPDFSTDDEEDVIRTNISRIENKYGNLMIYAEWEEVPENSGLYRATVDEKIKNGQVSLTKNMAAENEWIFVTVSKDSGYKLKSLLCTPTNQYVSQNAFMPKVISTMPVSMEISLNQVSDGVYYFVMPGSDVEVTAVFEPIKYDIIYETYGGTHKNVTSYTVEDDVVFEEATKEGYTFKGWFDVNGQKIEQIARQVGDMILLAKWEKADNIIVGEEVTEEEQTKEAQTEPSTKEETKPTDKNSFMESGNIKTGDSTNVMHLVIICVICAVLLFLIIPKKKEKDDDEEEEVQTQDTENK